MADFKRYMTDMSHDELMEACRRIRHVALDMDGTIYLGSQLFPFTKPFLQSLAENGIRYSFLTNNPTKVLPIILTSCIGLALMRLPMRYIQQLWLLSIISVRIILR